MRIRLRVNSRPFAQFVSRAIDATDTSRPGPMQDGMIEASDALWSFERSRFSLASAGDGTWAPLAASTVASRKSKGESEPMPVLHERGDLENSLHRGGANHVLEVSDSSVIEGTRDSKARFHQDGGANLPAREIVVEPTAEAIAQMKERIVEGAKAAIAQATSGGSAPGAGAGSATEMYPQAA